MTPLQSLTSIASAMESPANHFEWGISPEAVFRLKGFAAGIRAVVSQSPTIPGLFLRQAPDGVELWRLVRRSGIICFATGGAPALEVEGVLWCGPFADPLDR